MVELQNGKIIKNNKNYEISIDMKMMSRKNYDLRSSNKFTAKIQKSNVSL